PLAIALEDLQWADPDTLDLIAHVSGCLDGRPFLLICTYRHSDCAPTPARLLPTLTALSRNAEHRRVSLRSLSVGELAEHLPDGAGRALPPDLTRAIHDETSGNPFYARELLRHIVERGAMGERERRWGVDRDVRELGVPGSVRDVVHHRLSLLTTE